MKKAYLFDIDGTLTLPRQRMDPEFAGFFIQFAKDNIVYLSTGSDRPKALEQVGSEIMNACRGVFTCCGNEFWEGEKLVYEREFYPGIRLVNFLKDCVEKSSFPTKAGRHLEYRKGMLNFSVVGRNATREERASYSEWDAKHREREEIANTIIAKRERFGMIDVSVGGEISIDIYPVGRDKSQSVTTVRQLHGLPIVFMGDKMKPNGNDYPAVKALIEGDLACEVSSWQQTKLLIESELERQDG
jgi:phosphomannomutase